MKIKLLLLAFVTSVTLRAADSLPAFNALMTMGREHRFVLVSPAGEASAWLRLGATFDGYTLKAYDEKAGGLDLERDGKVTTLHLVADAATQSSGAAGLPSTKATLADAEDVLRVMHFDEMIGKMMEQQKKALGPAMQRMLAQMKVPAEDRDRFVAMQKKILDETMDTLSGPEMKADVARIYSDIFSKEELASLGSFYSTPAGQSMIAKQPQVQEKMMQAMMPRMMEIGPKLQQMAKNFAAEQAAKAAPQPPAPITSTPTPGKP